ncbi:putative inorganic phosphate cotransporter [Osmia bicornis bicornis]|uniref:putative inorganic phosphate cotransporter n=1 Tax=Osmia bicornis bicornis TaxID=1437191 RepID=UPI0010F7E341|nr:putative inorganic phosphate cotransporter [Osmia bicornis bicornis]XP_029050701.1 putative inorganic phosphate cotransporter [Osmia bicornis bicornis]XP_029050702.1 putative inorganic phosphate cotransporter [Osmia bicornis bicornis]
MLSVWKACCGRIPQRWIFAIMGFLAVFNAYAMRVCLSITITEMVRASENTTKPIDDTCDPMGGNDLDDNVDFKPSNAKQYEWDERTQGIILSSFYWGYVVTHLPGGMLSEKFGGKYSLGLGILATAVFTLLTPLVLDLGDAPALIIVRVLMGLCEGTTYPALNAMLAQWTPPQERSMIGSLVFAGAQLGTVFANSLSGIILHYSTVGWPAVFYVFGSVGVLWFLVWLITCYNTPDTHPFISEKEINFLRERMQAHTHKKPPSVPWRHLLRSVPLWALIAAQIGHDWGFFTLVNDLPKYMSSVLKYSIKSNGLLSALPYLTMWICSVVTSCLADWMITRGFMSRTNVRKLGTTIASLGPGAFVMGASYAKCDRTTVVLMFTLGTTLMGTFYPGMKVNALDLSPNYSGTLMALVNGIGAFSGILTPYIVGELTPNGTLTEWRLVFWIVLAVFLVTNLIFVLYASGEVECWNDPEFIRQDREERRTKAMKNGEEKIEKTLP